jgi:hypothetical protein
MATATATPPITWPPATDIPAEERDRKLDQFFDSQIPIEDAIIFFLEVKTLLTGSRDKVKAVGVTGERNWCYPGLAKFPNCDAVDIILKPKN